MIKAAILGSLMTAIVLILRKLLQNRLPRMCFKLLWILTAVRFIVPLWFNIDIEVASESKPIQKEPSAIVYTAHEWVSPGEAIQMASSEPKQRIDTVDILRAVHVIGALTISGFMVFAYTGMRRLALQAKPVGRGLAKRWGNVTVRCGDGFSSPFSCGVIRPIIFIPSHMLSLDPCQLDVIMAHEMRHILSFDQLTKWFITASVCLHWYNPLAWIMLHFANRDIELACDEAVVKSLGKKADYAMTLIAAEEVRNTATVCSFGAPVLNERIEFIMKSKKTTICGFAAATVILAMMTVFFINVNAVETQAEETTRIDSPVANIEADIEMDEYIEPEDNVICEEDNCIADPVIETDNPDLENEIISEDELFEVTTVELLEEIPIVDCVEESSKKLDCPLEEYGEITGMFGYQTSPVGVTVFNKGINVSAKEGTEVTASADGKVIYASYSFQDGNMVTIDHGDGFATHYGHLGEIECEIGDDVKAGEAIGTVGMTGLATGPNLYFAVDIGGAYIDPARIFE